MTRHIVLLLPLVVCLSGCSQNQVARDQSAGEDKAVQSIEAVGGRVARDEKLPGRPVVAVDLGDTNVTDSDLKDLKELKGLQDLDLGFTQITDAGLKNLKELKGLQSLDLRDAQITDAGMKDLKQALPTTRIWGP